VSFVSIMVVIFTRALFCDIVKNAKRKRWVLFAALTYATVITTHVVMFVTCRAVNGGVGMGCYGLVAFVSTMVALLPVWIIETDMSLPEFKRVKIGNPDDLLTPSSKERK